MRKKFFLLPCFVLMSLFFSCDFSEMSIPESVSVKANARYSFMVGEYSESMSKYISVDDILDTISDSATDSSLSGFDAYDYNPGGNSEWQQFLVQFRILDIPLDMGEYLANLDVMTSLAENMSFEQEIEIPDFSDMSQTVDFDIPDFNEIIRDSMKEITPGNKTLPIVETKDTISVASKDAAEKLYRSTITITSPTFDYMQYSAGRLDITLTRTDTTAISGGFAVKLQAHLSTGSKEISGAAADVTDGGTVSVPLKGAEIAPSMTLYFTGSYGGGAPSSGSPVTHTYSVGIAMSADAKLSYAKNLTIETDTSQEIDETLSLSSADFVECAVKSGSVRLSTADTLSGMTGVTCTPSITLSGGLTAGKDDWSAAGSGKIVDHALSLAGKTLKNENIAVGGSLSFTIKNADIDMTKVPAALSVAADVNIESLTSVTVDMASRKDNLSFSSQTALENTDYVDKITLESVRLGVTYTNGLPAENDIKVSAASDLLQMKRTDESAKGTLCAFTTNDREKYGGPSSSSWNGYWETDEKTPLIIGKDYGTDNLTLDLTDEKQLDFSADILLPGMNTDSANPYYATLRNIEIGATYMIAVAITPEFRWQSVTLDLAALTESGDDSPLCDNIDTGINLSSILDGGEEDSPFADILQNLQFTNVPVYLCAVKPDTESLNGISFTGTAFLSAGSSDPVFLVGGESNDGNLPLVAKTISLETDGDTVVTNFEELSKGTDYSCAENIAGLFKQSSSGDTEEESGLCLSYNLTMTANGGADNKIEVKYDDLYDENGEMKDGETASSIAITAYIAMPLVFSAVPDDGEDDVRIDIMSLVGNDDDNSDDLFDRDEKTSTDDIDKYISAIESCDLYYTAENGMLVSAKTSPCITFALYDETDGNKKPIYNQNSLPFSEGKLSIKTDTVTAMMNAWPLTAEVFLNLPKGNYYIPRLSSAELSINLKVQLATDGTITLFD